MATRSTAQSKPQKGTVSRVMHEFKHGELRTRGTGPKVKNRRQAIAIALNEAGASNTKSRSQNAQSLRRTKAKERQGETAQAASEGKRAQDKTLKEATTRKSTRKSPVRKTAAKKSAVRKSSAGKVAARKTAVKKTAVKKSATRKTLARKTVRTSAATRSSVKARNSARGGKRGNKTKAMLYAEARRKKIPGRSRMSKGELMRALG